jgi:glyoxylase-like metal-dependent hydrolase (beta-lactamase superfamily II)
MMRRKLKILLGFGGVAVVGLAFVMGPIAARIPTPQADRIVGNGVVGIVEGGSIAWIIPTQTGVVLIDAGGSADSSKLKAEIGDRAVHAILLTHGHFDHTAGVRNYPETEIIAGPGESGLVSGKEEAGGWMARMSKPMMGEPDYAPPLLREFADGDVIMIDGANITAIHVPGHTKGGAAYLWGEVLFVGDTVVGRDGYVNELPKPLYDDYSQVPASVAKLEALNFEIIADGHVGLHASGNELLRAFLTK